MPIQLTSAFDPGDAGSGTLTHVRISDFRVNLDFKQIRLAVKHGTYVESIWTQGIAIRNVTQKDFSIQGDDYTTIITKLTSAADVSIYDEVARELYQWLLDNEHYAGTIV